MASEGLPADTLAAWFRNSGLPVGGTVEAHLFWLVIYHRLGDERRAWHNLQAARRLMAPSLRRRYEDPRFILPSTTGFRPDDFWESCPDALEHPFWKIKDPWLLTPENERVLEHWARLAVGQLLFQDHRQAVFVRYGRPLARTQFPMGLVPGEERTHGLAASGRLNPTWLDTTEAAHIRQERQAKEWINDLQDEVWDSWNYDDFFLNFKRKRFDFKPFFRLAPNSVQTYLDLLEKRPESYEFIRDEQRLPLVASAATFAGKSPGTTRLEIAWGVLAPDTVLAFPLTVGVFVLDSLWNKRAVHVDTLRSLELLWKSPASGARIGQCEFLLRPGRRFTCVEVEAANGARGRLLWAKEIPDFSGSALQISEIRLGFVDSTGVDSAGWRFLPLPSHQVLRELPAAIYFEVYNLLTDGYGWSRFVVSLRLEQAARTRPGSRLWRKLAFWAHRFSALTLSSQESNLGSSAHLLRTLDLNKVAPGDVLLTVEVRDLASGAKTATRLWLRVTDRAPAPATE
ncbi:MAG: hypothetical protein GXO73_09460 [Calditrichaeota bacterium]|nr:hypothetical protein [Calditrichota bacterium]